MSVKKLSDDEIVEGFINGDEKITRNYFYTYCQKAYRVCNKLYDLGKKGINEFAFAHRYYLIQANGHWKNLINRDKNISLQNWMLTRMKFMSLDLVDEYNKRKERLEYSDNLGDYEPRDRYSREEVYAMINDLCDNYYKDDPVARTILRLRCVYGMKGEEIALKLHMKSSSAVSQRWKKMKEEVVVPYFKKYYVEHEHYESPREEMYMQRSYCYDMAPSSIPGLTSFMRADSFVPKKPKLVTPELVESLKPGQVYVYGSDLLGLHVGRTARLAVEKFGAVMGEGSGLWGQSYGIPTMQGPAERVKPYVEEFTDFAKYHRDMKFLVTKVGCGIAGFDAREIAPMFKEASELKNVWLPQEFWDVL